MKSLSKKGEVGDTIFTLNANQEILRSFSLNALSSIGQKTVTFFYQLNESSLITSLVVFSTRGQRQTMDGPNFELFQEIVDGLTPMDSIIQTKVEILNNPQYFKVKTVSFQNQKEIQTIYSSNYLITNKTRTVGISLVQYGEDRMDIESSIRTLKMF